MTRDPGFDVLFEAKKIGPVVAKNRFFLVPHCADGQAAVRRAATAEIAPVHDASLVLRE